MWNNKDCLLLQSSEYKRFTAEFHFGRNFFAFLNTFYMAVFQKIADLGLKYRKRLIRKYLQRSDKVVTLQSS